MYQPFNDYELLYLYRDGNENAFNLLFKKYEHLIEITVNEYMPYGDKRSDLVQEGRIVLYDCIESFNESIGVTFYSFFIIALKRRLRRLKTNDYYQSYLELNEAIDYENDNNYSSFNTLSKLIIHSIDSEYSNDELGLNIFKECILGGMKLMEYSRVYNISYNIVYYKYRQIIDSIRYNFK